MITTNEASKMLGITRKQFVELLMEGFILFQLNNGNYKVDTSDVLKYKDNVI